MIGRILCSLGFHGWVFRDSFLPHRSVVLTYARCRRCGDELIVNIDHVEDMDWR